MKRVSGFWVFTLIQHFLIKCMFNILQKKISTSLYFIRTAKNFLTDKALKLLYFSFVHSHIIYAIQVWSSCPAGQLDQIYKLQKKAVRLIRNSKYNAHTQPIFKKLQILPLPDLISFFRIQFMQKFQFGLLPAAFVDVWTTMAARQQQNLHNYPLRNSKIFLSHLPGLRWLKNARIISSQKFGLSSMSRP